MKKVFLSAPCVLPSIFFGQKSIRFFAVLSALCVFVVQSAFAQDESPAKKEAAWPNTLLCGKKNNLLHMAKGKIDWEYELDGPLFDVQPQPQEDRYLVTGGTNQVAYVRKVWKGCRVLWDWGAFQGVSIVSAVAADWGPEGDPALVLAADTVNQKLFLGEAKSKSPKMRWEYKLPAKPRKVRLCPDTGNFLVVLEDSSVLEIFFQEDKVAWSLGKQDGLREARDAVRGPWANTFVADGATGEVLSFTATKKLNWKTKLPFIPALPVTDMALSLFKKKGKRMVMVSAHFTSGPGSKNVLYLLNAETGNVLAWKDRLENGKGIPAFTRALPDLAVYQKKQ